MYINIPQHKNRLTKMYLSKLKNAIITECTFEIKKMNEIIKQDEQLIEKIENNDQLRDGSYAILNVDLTKVDRKYCGLKVGDALLIQQLNKLFPYEL